MAQSRGVTGLQDTESAPRDYVAIALEFAQQAIDDTEQVRNCNRVRQACERFMHDLERAMDPGCLFYFDPWHAEDACGFIEKLPHVEGKWDTDHIVLHPAQVLFVVQLFGFRMHRTGGRRFTSALYCTARKSGKSTLGAGIELYCECCEDEPGAQLLSAATTFPQASIVFNTAKRMVEMTHDLQEAFGLDVWAKSITRHEVGSSFKPIHSKASTQDGLNPSHVVLDEIHAHKTPDLLNVLTSAAGARDNPLWLYLTTEGYTNAGPWSDIRGFVTRMLDGVFGYDADHFLALFFAVDAGDGDFQEDAWVKANPLIEDNPKLLDAIRKEAVEAKQMPSKLAEFRIKRLNRPAATAEGWINLEKWAACDAAAKLDELKDVPCYGGLDLSSTTDLTALRLVWIVEGIVYTHGWNWAPERAVSYRTERGTVPYSKWVQSGHITMTDGDTVDYNAVEAKVLEVCEQFNVQHIGYDRWNASQLVNNLVEHEVPLVEFVQGPKSYHPAMQALEMAYIAGRVAHGGDPVLHWAASNIVARRDVNMNMAPDKRRSADKIDSMVALLMAMGLATDPPEAEQPKEYQLLFVG